MKTFGDMKKMMAISAACAALLSAGCSNFTQEMKDGASFANLTRAYVDEPSGLGAPFAARAAEINARTRAAVAEFLKEQKYEIVENAKEAQIIFRPLWSMSLSAAESTEPDPVFMQASKPLSLGSAGVQAYATLEIQAVLPDSGDVWSWRGFSPINMAPANATSGLIKDQVAWCLKYFPPEKYPSALEAHKKKREAEKAEAAQNPFNEVLIKERQKRESAE